MTDMNALTFERDEWGRLVLKTGDGKTFAGVDPVRCFPLSDPEKAIALLDPEGKEILTLPDMDSLNPAAREALRTELSARDFIPVIQKVLSASNPSPPCEWSVETDRGATKFLLESEDDVRKLGPNRVMIADSNGIRYTIPDIQKLDSHSQRIVHRLV